MFKLNVKCNNNNITVFKMTSHCASTEHMREESENRIRKWKRGDLRRLQKMERGAAVTLSISLFDWGRAQLFISHNLFISGLLAFALLANFLTVAIKL